MLCLKIGAGAVNQTPLDWEGNVQNIKDVIQEALRQGVSILCLPELCITGYGCEDRFHSMDVQRRAFEALREIAAACVDIVVCVGLPVAYNNALYNTMAVIVDGEIQGLVAKQHLAGDGLHYEPRWFKPWPAGCRGHLRDFSSYEIGDLQFDVSGVRLGFEICEDAWVAERPGAHLARKGVDIILNPSASHFAFGKHEIRKRFVIEGSRAFAVTYVYANLLGNEAGRAIYDGDCFIASGGTLVAEETERFSMKPWRLLTAVVDVEATRTQQMSSASFTPQYDDDLSAIPSHDTWDLPLSNEVLSQAAADTKTMDKFDEFSAAVTLGLFDYMRKSRSKGFVISLSGGADSAACALLVRLMIDRGLEELGEEGFNERAGLPNIPEKVLPCKLLTCMYQATKNSSDLTQNAARTVATDAGAAFHSVDIEPIVKAYTSMIAVAVQHDFTWDQDDLTLQNIQARARAPGIWMIANMQHKLLITTSNRSEAAVGYCTMDGDTAGSLAPLGGIDKAFLLKWIDSDRIRARFEMSHYNLVRLKPTAELRPGSSQTDEDDLMPYPILEFIEDRAILEKKSPKETYTCLRQRFPKYDDKDLLRYVEKFFTLWCRNQWKRERYALSFHVDDKNLDPRSWCRFPVLSGGFTVELEELRKELKLP